MNLAAANADKERMNLAEKNMRRANRKLKQAFGTQSKAWRRCGEASTKVWHFRHNKKGNSRRVRAEQNRARANRALDKVKDVHKQPLLAYEAAYDVYVSSGACERSIERDTDRIVADARLGVPA